MLKKCEDWKTKNSIISKKRSKALSSHNSFCISAIGIFKWSTIQSRELLIIQICHEEAQEERRHSLLISRDMLIARLRRFDVGVDDSIGTLGKKIKRRRYERRSRSQTLQPEVTTSSLLGWWLHLHWWQLLVVVVVVAVAVVVVTGSSGAELTTLPDARRPCSSSNSWPMKFRFGLMIGRALFTSLYASTIDRPLCRIM